MSGEYAVSHEIVGSFTSGLFRHEILIISSLGQKNPSDTLLGAGFKSELKSNRIAVLKHYAMEA
jgi:hypothetical protein